MSAELPWNLVLIGAIIAVIVELIGIPVLPFAIGIYLPVALNACIMVGGVVRLIFDKSKKPEEEKKETTNKGILFCSGMIAGEGLVGILLAVFAIFGIDKLIDISGFLGLGEISGSVASLVIFGLVILSLVCFSALKKNKKNG